jgi:predicted DNA-binding transcriptional regulator AlpA
MTPDEVARTLRVSEGTLRNWRSALLGPDFVRIGRVVRYPASDIERYLDESWSNLPR